MDVLKHLFERHFHLPVERVEPLQGGLGGSGRNILRLAHQDQSAVGILYDVRQENVAFLDFSRHFRTRGLPVPEIYASELDAGAYLEEDLGDVTLFQFLSDNRAGDDVAPDVVEAYRNVVAHLPRFQIEASRDLNYKVCYPRSSFDGQSIAWDLNYFKYYFLKLAGIPFSEQQLEDDFRRLTRFLLTASRDSFLYRDFQSRNVMLRGGQPFFLDYQGGRKGALHYDIASLLYDAKADLPPALRQQLLDHYLASLARFVPLTAQEFMRHYYAFVYVRIMQAMGAYGFRGFYERKPHFLQSVPFALKNLRWLLENVRLPIALPTLLGAFEHMIESDKLRHLIAPAETEQEPAKSIPPPASRRPNLALRIFSFSFHRSAAPKDESGHGGGFIFDARALPNPGREERFKSLTG
ncbi:MAG TPA: phosphotransferase, partial [Bryobacteraceae bacterium]|nr:phosphotransferase [Bryobacteraceae bacterium]